MKIFVFSFFLRQMEAEQKRRGINRETGEDRELGEAVILPVFGAIDKENKKI
ncbi:MAG: hypothetical protein HFI25_08535 [Lachnospiraceae bacterium]|nr:hypothetical protein [Lachnospiraceae bacterium]